MLPAHIEHEKISDHVCYGQFTLNLYKLECTMRREPPLIIGGKMGHRHFFHLSKMKIL